MKKKTMAGILVVATAVISTIGHFAMQPTNKYQIVTRVDQVEQCYGEQLEMVCMVQTEYGYIKVNTLVYPGQTLYKRCTVEEDSNYCETTAYTWSHKMYNNTLQQTLDGLEE